MSRYLDPVEQMLTLPDIRRSRAEFHLTWSIGFVVLGTIVVGVALRAASAPEVTCAPGVDCSAMVGASRALTLAFLPFGVLFVLALSIGGAYMIRHRLWFNRSADSPRCSSSGSRSGTTSATCTCTSTSRESTARRTSASARTRPAVVESVPGGGLSSWSAPGTTTRCSTSGSRRRRSRRRSRRDAGSRRC